MWTGLTYVGVNVQAMPVAMAQLRDVHGVCIPDVLRFLLDLFKYNDNTKNKFSDNYYRAALVEALANTITPAAATTVSLLTGLVGINCAFFLLLQHDIINKVHAMQMTIKVTIKVSFLTASL